MTYKEVLDDLFSIIQNHKMIRTAGYGPLSEIKVPRGTYDTNYPYAFLQPTNHTISKNAITYRFNLIMMEMCNEDIDSVITAQSNCLQYVKDILGHLYYHYDKYDFNLNFSIAPFKEKYDDVVSGVTATIELQTRDALNDCIAPFIGYGNLIVEATNLTDITLGPDPGDNTAFTFSTAILTDGNWNVNKYEVPESGTYTVILEMGIRLLTPTPGESIPIAPKLNELTEGLDRTINPTKVENWPDTFVNDTIVYNTRVEFEKIDVIRNVGPGTYTWEFPFLKNQPSPESQLVQVTGSKIYIYKSY